MAAATLAGFGAIRVTIHPLVSIGAREAELHQHTDGLLDTQLRQTQARRLRAVHFLVALCTLGLALAPPANSQTKHAATRHASARPAGAKPSELPAPQKTYGSASAPITMEVFSDYQCPMCRN